MRYYLYLDESLIKTLFSSVAQSDFDVDVMILSIQQGESITDDLSIAPEVSGRDICRNAFSKDNCSEDSTGEQHGRVGVFSGKKTTYNTMVERRFINIEDISSIKNRTFYNNLVKKLEKDDRIEDGICIEKGVIYPCSLRYRYSFTNREIPKNNEFFCINNKFIWLDSTKLETDLLVLSSLVSEVTVIGYCINQCTDRKIIKAIAIYV